ncbi:MAG: methyltransferase type 11 [Ignavibacteriales bacterium CG_4_9_14_3_um_filter_34_10]|nr:MAG: methyltransferase type 11 [Ignavibacteriales bacterium CG_4_9_14_3_um_filter_34_10]
MKKNLNNIIRNSVRGDRRGNLANWFRNERTKFFLGIIGKLKYENLKILDVGGTDYFWTTLNSQLQCKWRIDLVNLNKEANNKSAFNYILADGRDLSAIQVGYYDIIFSNSVIEHVGDFEDQEKFANEIRRVGKKYFIQTPNYYFPFEPHFLFIGFQFLPVKFRASLIRHFNLGWFKKEMDYKKSLEIAKSVRLLKKKEIQILFPDATIYREKFLCFTKSFLIYYGFE